MGLLKVIWATLTDFGHNTEIPGFKNAYKAKSLLRFLYWLAIFVVGLAFTFVSLRGFIADYLSYPVVTATDLTNRASVQFPAVTVCNLNR